MKGTKALFVASWVLLLFIDAVLMFGAFASTARAYSGGDDPLAGVTFDQIRTLGGDDAVKAIRGRRATAATWALAYTLIMGWTVVAAYRRRQRWAWWAIFVSVVGSQLVSIGRVAFLASVVGAGTSGILLAMVLLGLMAGAPYMFSRDPLPA